MSIDDIQILPPGNLVVRCLWCQKRTGTPRYKNCSGEWGTEKAPDQTCFTDGLCPDCMAALTAQLMGKKY